MSEATIKQKLGLIVFGILLALVVLEGALRVGAAVFYWQQDRRNLASSDGTVQVLCVGESTTALGGDFSYPSQLQGILDRAAGAKKFHVINKGVPAVTSLDILRNVDSYIDRYRPQVAVLMIGINDEFYYKNFGQDLTAAPRPFWGSLRTVKLAKFLALHLRNRFVGGPREDLSAGSLMGEQEGAAAPEMSLAQQFNLDSQGPEILERIRKLKEAMDSLAVSRRNMEAADPGQSFKLIDERTQLVQKGLSEQMYLMGLWYKSREEEAKAETFFQGASVLWPHNPESFIEWGLCLKQRKKFDQAEAVFKQAVLIDPQKANSYLELARLYDQTGNKDLTKEIYLSLLSATKSLFWVHLEIGDWFFRNKMFPEAALAYERCLGVESGRNTIAYRKLSEALLKVGKQKESDEILSKLNEITKGQNLPGTLHNYELIVKKFLAHGIKTIVMQYPLRPIEPLKAALPYDGLVFVENKENFENALSRSHYTDYFSDYFAGDFGHCKMPGNRLIAENLAQRILSEVLLNN